MRARLRWPRLAVGLRREDGALFVHGNPVAPRPPGSGVVAAGAATRPALVRILLADHNPSSIELARGALVRSGIRHDLQITRDCQEIRDLLFPGGYDTPAFLPNLILLALNLPAGESFEIYRAIRASTLLSDVPVVLLATSTREEDIRRKYRITDNTYVRTPAGLSETIEGLGSHWAIFALLPPVA